jgi:hypothetical protein
MRGSARRQSYGERWCLGWWHERERRRPPIHGHRSPPPRVFGKGIDALVRELDAIGGFKSEIARDWLWIQADNLQEAKDAHDTKMARSIRDSVERYLDDEIRRLHRTPEPGQ